MAAIRKLKGITLTVVFWGVALVVLPLLLVLEIVLLIRRVKGKKNNPLPSSGTNVMPGDSFWLQESEVNNSNINILFVMRGDADVRALRRTIHHRLIPNKVTDDALKKTEFRKLTHFVEKNDNRYTWLPETDFRIEDHVFAHVNCVPNNPESVEDMVKKICSEPLPRLLSPWQIIIIPPNKAKPNFYLALFRIHHCMGDGTALIRLLLPQILDDQPVMITNPRRNGILRQICIGVNALIIAPYYVIGNFILPKNKNILHGIKLCGEKQIAWTDPVDLKLMKAIKTATRSTINDVIMTCISGAFSAYFQRFSTSSPTSILSAVAVNVRPSSAKLTLDNQFVLAFVSLPTEAMSVLDRLRETKQNLSNIRAVSQVVKSTLDYILTRLPDWLSKKVIDMYSAKCTVAISNVSTYSTEIHIAGEVVEDMMCWIPQRADIGLGFSIVSYKDHIQIGLVSDKAVMSNPKILLDEFHTQLQMMANALKID